MRMAKALRAMKRCTVITFTSIGICLSSAIVTLAANEQETRGSRAIPLADGEIRVTTTDDGDEIEIVDKDGDLLSLSVCAGPGKRYDALVGFFRAFQRAVALGQRDQVLEMLHVPLRVGRGEEGILRSRDRILADYDEVFDESFLQQLKAIDPRRVFCNWQGVMIGEGMVWAEVYDGELKIITINRPDG